MQCCFFSIAFVICNQIASIVIYSFLIISVWILMTFIVLVWSHDVRREEKIEVLLLESHLQPWLIDFFGNNKSMRTGNFGDTDTKSYLLLGPSLTWTSVVSEFSLICIAESAICTIYFISPISTMFKWVWLSHRRFKTCNKLYQ